MRTYYLIGRENDNNPIVTKGKDLESAIYNHLKNNDGCMAWCIGDFGSANLKEIASEIAYNCDWVYYEWEVLDVTNPNKPKRMIPETNE